MKFLLVSLALLAAAYICGIFLFGMTAGKAKDKNYIPLILVTVVMLAPIYFLMKADMLYILPYIAGLILAFMQTVDPFALTQETADRYGEYAKAKAEADEKKKDEAYQEKRRREAEEKAYQQALEHERKSSTGE